MKEEYKRQNLIKKGKHSTSKSTIIDGFNSTINNENVHYNKGKLIMKINMGGTIVKNINYI